MLAVSPLKEQGYKYELNPSLCQVLVFYFFLFGAFPSLKHAPCIRFNSQVSFLRLPPLSVQLCRRAGAVALATISVLLQGVALHPCVFAPGVLSGCAGERRLQEESCLCEVGLSCGSRSKQRHRLGWFSSGSEYKHTRRLSDRD